MSNSDDDEEVEISRIFLELAEAIKEAVENNTGYGVCPECYDSYGDPNQGCDACALKYDVHPDIDWLAAARDLVLKADEVNDLRYLLRPATFRIVEVGFEASEEDQDAD